MADKESVWKENVDSDNIITMTQEQSSITPLLAKNTLFFSSCFKNFNVVTRWHGLDDQLVYLSFAVTTGVCSKERKYIPNLLFKH